MMHIVKQAALGSMIWASAVQADSLCGIRDDAALRAVMEGAWTLTGATSVETETLSVTQGIDGRLVVDGQGRFTLATGLEGGDLPEVRIDQDSRTLTVTDRPYDVDGVDDMLDTVEADWIADAVSATPCGPEDLPQLSARIEVPGEVDSTITFILYFDDRIVMISESELTGDWGLAFVTAAGLVEPVDPVEPVEAE